MINSEFTFPDIAFEVIKQLRKQNYMESTIHQYQLRYEAIYKYMENRGIDKYTPIVGEEYIEHKIELGIKTLDQLKCSVRRLNEYISGKDYLYHKRGIEVEVPYNFKNILMDYLNSCKERGNKNSTIIQKRKTITMFLVFLSDNGYTDISLIDTSIISKSLIIYENKDNYAILRSFVYWLFQKNIIRRDLSLIIPKFRRPKVLPSTYTPDEIRRIESAIDQTTLKGKRDLAIIMLATRMGLRSGDIASLKWSELDLDKGYLSIEQKKTGSPLSLQIPDEVLQAIQLHEKYSIHNKRNDDYVFHSMIAPYNHISTSIIRHITSEYFAKANVSTVGKKHGPHTFRSSLATSMINDGISYGVVQKVLGHSDPDVIKHYAKTDIERLRLCAIEPPPPQGLFREYLLGKRKIVDV